MNSSLNLVSVYDNQAQMFFGWLKGKEHIIGAGANLKDLMADVLDSINIVAQHQMEHDASVKEAESAALASKRTEISELAIAF